MEMNRVLQRLFAGFVLCMAFTWSANAAIATDHSVHYGTSHFSIDVSGTITDEQGQPLIGVNIQVKGTNQGTATDLDGRFALADVAEDAVLVISYIGYQTQEV